MRCSVHGEDRVTEKTVELMVDVPVPQMVEEIIEIPMIKTEVAAPALQERKRSLCCNMIISAKRL